MAIIRTVPIGCYLMSDEVERLREYAESLELSVPSLCRLLVQHELQSGQLNNLKNDYFRKVGKEGERVTARFANRTIKDQFSAHIRRCQLGSDDAVGVLFRAEPHEQWLKRALKENGIRP